MSEQRKKNEKNFLVQGSILAIAGVITKLIGAFYRIPLLTASLWQYQNWYPQESP